MKYQILLQRREYFRNVKQPKGRKEYEDATIGDLILTDENGKILFECVTLENGGESTDTPNQDKRIIARDYALTWFNSTKNKSVAKRYPRFARENGRNLAVQLHTKELPAFSKRYILIHSGCYACDTEGCVLLGLEAHEGYILKSVDAIVAFYDILEKIGIENVTFCVREINGN